MSKGSKRERQCRDIYHQAGYVVYRPATVRFGENDMFGLFDLMALHPLTGELRLVQVKSNRATGIRGFSRKCWLFQQMGDHVTCEYAVPVDRQGWRLLRVDGHGGHRETFDGRESDANMGDGLTAFLSE